MHQGLGVGTHEGVCLSLQPCPSPCCGPAPSPRHGPSRHPRVTARAHLLCHPPGPYHHCPPPPKGISFLFSTINLGGIPYGFLAGWIMDGFGRRKAVLLGGICAMMGTLLSGVAPTFGIASVARVITGVGIGAMSSSIPVYVQEMAPEGRTATFQVACCLLLRTVTCRRALCHLMIIVFTAALAPRAAILCTCPVLLTAAGIGQHMLLVLAYPLLLHRCVWPSSRYVDAVWLFACLFLTLVDGLSKCTTHQSCCRCKSYQNNTATRIWMCP